MNIKMLDEERQCKNCRFYDKGNCKRYPPQIWETENNGGSNFPRVQENEWCGEFSPFEKWILPKGFKILDSQFNEIGET